MKHVDTDDSACVGDLHHSDLASCSLESLSSTSSVPIYSKRAAAAPPESLSIVTSPPASPTTSFSSLSPSSPSQVCFSFDNSRVFKSSKYSSTTSSPSTARRSAGRRPVLPKELLARHASGAIDLARALHLIDSTSRESLEGSDYPATTTNKVTSSSPMGPTYKIAKVSSYDSISSLTSSSCSSTEGNASPFSYQGSASSSSSTFLATPQSEKGKQSPSIKTPPSAAMSPTERLVGDPSSPPLSASVTSSSKSGVLLRQVNNQYRLSLSELMEVNGPQRKRAHSHALPRSKSFVPLMAVSPKVVEDVEDYLSPEESTLVTRKVLDSKDYFLHEHKPKAHMTSVRTHKDYDQQKLVGGA